VIRYPRHDPHDEPGQEPPRTPDPAPGGRVEPTVDWSDVEFGRPSQAASPSHDRRPWWWVAAALLGLAIAVVIFRSPLADMVWPDLRVQQQLDAAERALQQGHLSAADGTGARQHFEAAQALDSDRSEPREGLVRVGLAAIAEAGEHVRANRFEQARRSLALARELQVPRAAVEVVALQLRERESIHGGVGDLMHRAAEAQAAGQMETALPLYQRVLDLQPNHTAALEGREDVLSELLQQARKAIAQEDLARGSALIAQVRQNDPGHIELPAAQAALAGMGETQRRSAERELRRKRLEPALSSYQQALSINAEDAAAQQGVERVATAYAQQAAREAADFDFAGAAASLRKARELSPQSPAVKEAEQAVARARQSQSRLVTAVPPRQRTQSVQALLAAMDQAAARGDWLTPPGESAYDKLRAAQALAPGDAAVKRATARILPATRTCFEEELRSNRVRRARACYDAWQTLETRDAGLANARRRLALKWIAVGDERLGSGDVAFAAQALQEARELDGSAPGLAEFSARVRSAQAGGN
jgi:tetratricopeptide (TPR) repeat protein